MQELGGQRGEGVIFEGGLFRENTVIKFIEVICKIGAGRVENQVSYFIWPK